MSKLHKLYMWRNLACATIFTPEQQPKKREISNILVSKEYFIQFVT